MATDLTLLHNLWRIALASLGLSVVSVAALAQSSTFDVGLGAEVSDSSETYFVSTGIDINRATRTKTFALQAASELDTALNDGDLGLRDPSLSLSYGDQRGPVRFDISLGYSESELTGLVAADPEDETLVSSDFVIDDGTRVSRSGRALVSFGDRAPFGGSLSVFADEIDYRDVTDGRLSDRSSEGADAQLRFDINPVVRLTAGYGVTGVKRADEEDRETLTQSWSAGAIMQASRVLTLDGQVSLVEIEDRSNVSGTVVSEDIAYNMKATLDRPTGAFVFGFSRRVETGGQLDRLSLARDMQLSDEQSFRFGIAASKLDEQDVGLEADISYVQRLKNSQIQLSAAQSQSFTDLNDPVTSRQITGSLSTALTKTSSVTADLQLASIEYQNGAFPDNTSFEVGAGYTHQLTQNWDFSSRAYFSQTEAGSERESEKGLSLSLSRTFELFD